MPKWKGFMKELGTEFQKDNVPLLAAAQAYYYLLAIVPMLILILSLVPYLNIDPNAAVKFISNSLPDGTASVFRENIISIVTQPKGGLLTIGILGTIWSASSGMTAFIQASNQAYDVKEDRSFVKVKLLSIFLTFGMILALAVALLLPVFGEVIFNFVQSFVSLPGEIMVLLQLARWLISIIVMSGVLLLLYRFAPNKKLPFSGILPGAILTTVLWLIISFAFSFYVSNFGNYSATYGSLGGIIILMIWFFLTGLILMVGAEINYILNRQKHSTGS
ncbi:YihY family inner membrane protein [Pontibacillus yanchengensis]|uniref:YihY family inner membrane protein n=2 Tax=Pontibacillus yanchengensis TaxID=462910 RepID=A0ACC7VII8_9BACI|nr:YihY family inner membrane protein [Pontibacillus yanchengensis]MYL54435.1 YihY family inner membrane protein [Pontibacillus yanchengensis]